MCFSATASFTASAILLPVGLYSLNKAKQLDQPYWLFALYPLLFGIQQAFEGWLWLELDAGGGGNIRTPAWGFLFFSHLFWLAWVPLSCTFIETQAWKRKLFLSVTVAGTLLGLYLYVPAFVHEGWLRIDVVNGSILYNVGLLFEEHVSRFALRVLYAFIVLIPLLLSSQRLVRYFGVLILVSVIVAELIYTEVFISVWCYFAAVLSAYILYMLVSLGRQPHAPGRP